MAESLGLHLDCPLKAEASEERSRRIKLFWWMHQLQSALSLRLGKRPAIAEDDITLSKTASDIANEGPYPVVTKWIGLSLLYGKLYSELWCSAAMQQSEDVRSWKATKLASDLKDLYHRVSPAEVSAVHGIKCTKTLNVVY